MPIIKNEDQDVTLECSGQACRELEQILADQDRDWYELFTACLLYENQFKTKENNQDGEVTSERSFFNVTRLDLALDEHYSEEGNYALISLNRYLEAGEYTSRKKKYRAYLGGNMAHRRADGVSLYIGSKQSPLFFRFYEKDFERAEALGISVEAIHELYGYKNRFEISIHKEISDRFVHDYVREEFDLGQRGVEIINDNLTVYADDKQHLDADWFD